MEESTEKRKAGRPKGSVKKSPQNSPGHPKMGGHKAYYPPMEEWAAACEFTGSKRAMARFLGMSPEWLHNFLIVGKIKNPIKIFFFIDCC